MKKITFCLLIMVFFSFAYADNTSSVFSKKNLLNALNTILKHIENSYVYLNQKKVDFQCLKNQYGNKISQVKTKAEAILLFEHLLNEFYDSHMSLNTNVQASYRLKAPIFVEIENDKTVIRDVWVSHIKNIEHDLLGTEIISFNGKPIQKMIDEFPILCSNKKDLTVKQWIVNKIIAGRYDQPRLIELKAHHQKKVTLDLDQLQFQSVSNLLSTHINNNIGIIRFHNSLGNPLTVKAFDHALKKMNQTNGLIIDLRNTPSGGNSYVARGIMSRFIESSQPYQIHRFNEGDNSLPAVTRKWKELVIPRGKTYKKPVIVLVNHWTGSMGEGIAIGFDGMKRATVAGTKMARLAGAIGSYPLNKLGFNYQFPIEQLFHINGTPRENYSPKLIIKPQDRQKDLVLETAIKQLNQ